MLLTEEQASLMRPVDEIVLDVLRKTAHELLSLCEQHEQERFGRYCTEGIDALSREQLGIAIGLLQRTLKPRLAGAPDQ